MAPPRILITASLNREVTRFVFYAVCIILLSHKDDESSVHSLLVIHISDRHQSRFSQNEANMGAEFWEKLVCVSDSWNS